LVSSSVPELRKLTAGKRLARNTLGNLLGDGSPFIVALITIPKLVHGLGIERFGLLTLVWMVIGYFGVFDFGLGRAVTNLVAQHLGRDDERSIGPLVWTGIILMTALGVAGALVLFGTAHWIVYSVLKIPPTLRAEALRAFYLFSLSIPAVITTTAFRGFLEAHQRFGLAIAIRMPMSIYAMAAPLAVLPFSHSLVPIVATLVVGRFIGLAIHAGICVARFPTLRPALQWSSEAVRPLLSFGGWMTVSNVVNPIMSDLDRFLVGAIVSIQAVAFYATPYDVVTKLFIIPSSFSSVFFPAFSATLVADPGRTRSLYLHAIRSVAMIMAPITLAVVLGARLGLRIWLGPEFASHSTTVVQVLAVGTFIAALTFIPFALIQGAARPDWIAKLQLIELPIYLSIFWVLTRRFGITGAAVAFLIRFTIELIVFFILGNRLLRRRSSLQAVGSPEGPAMVGRD
jgi:O-antigen/teichoic acid export membrane protein